MSPDPGPLIALYVKHMGSGFAPMTEELGSQTHPLSALARRKKGVQPTNGNGSTNGQPRLRDKLSLLIRDVQLESRPGETLCS